MSARQDKENMPCRSCANFSEESVEMHRDCLGGSIAGASCSSQLLDGANSFLTYGVDDEDDGRARCHGYVHAGFDW